MTIQELTNRMNAAEEKMNKCLVTIERHKAQKQKKIDKWNKLGVGEFSTLTRNEVRDMYEQHIISNEDYWLFSDIESKDNDIKGATQKYEDAKQTFKNWQKRLGAEEAKQQLIEDTIPQVIKDFLQNWKDETYDFFIEMKNNFYKDREELKEKSNKAIYKYLVSHPERYNTFFKYYAEEAENYNPNYNYSYHINMGSDYRKIKHSTFIDVWEEEFKNKYSDPMFVMYKNRQFDDEWLDKTLTQEMNNKLVDLMARVTKVTGTITDVDSLRIRNGELNGVIDGERGTANVTTIGAGGWNIQRAHWRTLVHPIK